MVEFYPVFEHYDEDIIGDDYLDLILFWREPFADLLKQAGFKTIEDYLGITPEINDIINENLPPGKRTPWSDEMFNWTEPETALAMWAALRHALDTQSHLFQEWPGMAEEVDETLGVAERVFGRAAEHRARWHIATPGF